MVALLQDYLDFWYFIDGAVREKLIKKPLVSSKNLLLAFLGHFMAHDQCLPRLGLRQINSLSRILLRQLTSQVQLIT
jgi:intein/homing endonuclease